MNETDWIILIDEAFYVNQDNQYLDIVLDFITKFSKVKIALVNYYSGSSDNSLTRNRRAILNKKILKTKKCCRISFQEVLECSFSNDLFSKKFCEQVSYLLEDYKHVLILLSSNRHSENKKFFSDSVWVANNVYTEIDSVFAKFGSDIIMIKEPSVKDPLPNSKLCERYLELKECLVKAETNHKYVYESIGTEVALRNSYSYSKDITILNKKRTQTFRKIFKGKRTYLSIDFEKGTFEVHNSKGKHLGEYSYNGEQKSPADRSGKHDIFLT